jgi:hypothetical protein
MNDSSIPAADPAPADALTQVYSLAIAIAERAEADKVVGPHTLAGETLGKCFGLSPVALTESLEAAAAQIGNGSLTGVEGTLASQGVVLNALFNLLTKHAFKEPRTAEELSAYLKLALRAQAQSASALSALAEIKQGPRVVVTKQLNAAHQQIVNNAAAGETPRVRRVRSRSAQPAALPEPPPLPDHAQMDARIPREAAPAHQPVEPVDEIHRSAD